MTSRFGAHSFKNMIGGITEPSFLGIEHAIESVGTGVTRLVKWLDNCHNNLHCRKFLIIFQDLSI